MVQWQRLLKTNLARIPSLHDIPAAPTYLVEVISTIDITPDLVREKLKSLNPNKSPGHDNLHPYCLRELTDSISIPLPVLFSLVHQILMRRST